MSVYNTQNSDLAELQDDVTGLNSSLVGIEQLNSVRNEYGYNYGIASSLSALGLSPVITPEGVKITGTISQNLTAFVVAYANNNTIGYSTLTEDYVVKLFGTSNIPILVQWRDSNNTLHYDGLSSPKTIPSGSIIEGVYIQYQGTVSKSVNVDVQILICKKRYYDLGFTNYVPYALGNQVLTPALIEQVDSGAKNLYNPDDLRGVPTGLTVTRESDGTTLKINGTYTGSDYAYIFVGHFTGTKTGTYYLASTNTKTMNANTYYVYTDDNHMMLVRTDDNDVTYYNYTTVPSKIKVVIRVSPNASFNNDTVKILICTLVDWKVSQKFVPYRPNWDLVGNMINSEAITKRTWLKAANDLNTAITSGYYKFTGGTANTPLHTTDDYGMLTVSTFDNYINQVCYKYYSPRGTFVRYSTDSGSTWSAWSQFTETVVS